MLSKHKSSSLLALAYFLFICQFSYADTTTVTNYSKWNGSSYISNWGSGTNTIHTYSQGFSSYLDPVYTTSFSLYFKLLSGAPQSYVFSIYDTQGSPYPTRPLVVGDPALSTNYLPLAAPIFTTGTLTAPSSTSSFTKVTYDLGNLQLSQYKSYLATISTLNMNNGDGQYGLAGLGSPYGSGFQYTNQSLEILPWDSLPSIMVFEYTQISQ